MSIDKMIQFDTRVAEAVVAALAGDEHATLRGLWCVALANTSTIEVRVPLATAFSTIAALPEGDEVRSAVARLVGESVALPFPQWLWPDMPVVVRTVNYDGTVTRPGKVTAVNEATSTVTVEMWCENRNGDPHSFTSDIFSLTADGKWLSDRTPADHPEYIRRHYLHPNDSCAAADYRFRRAREALTAAFDKVRGQDHSTIEPALGGLEAAIAVVRARAAERAAAQNT